MGSFEIGGLKVEAGGRERGFLWAGPYFYPPCNQKIRKYVRIPFTVIRGTQEGSIFCLTAGVHPTEYVHIATAIRLSKEIDPNRLKGTLIIVPVVNIPGFEQREYINPIDGKNLQGNWPGKTEQEGGTISHLMLHGIFNELVSKADYYMDLHGADVHESVEPYSGFYKTGNREIDEKSEGMARALGTKYIRVTRGSEWPGSAQRIMPERGIPSAWLEAGAGDRMPPEEVERSFRAVLNVMKYLKMIDGNPLAKEEQVFSESVGVRVGNFGLFYLSPEVKVGHHVSKGQMLGEVKDLYGDTIETALAPVSGDVIFLIHNPVVERGENIIQIQRPCASQV